MTAEWGLLCVDAINICGRKNIDCLKCEVRCTEIIKTAQRKLLEYLIAHKPWVNTGTMDLIEMLKKLEAK
jgi:hypothetical protein